MNKRRSYHHGDLPTALLAAVDQIVREGGVGAVTLREAARRADVSHAAPAHHFGDKAGLVTAYATQGFEALRQQVTEAAVQAEAVGEQALLAIGLAYVRFAVDQPGYFSVMFRRELLDPDRPGFREACDSAFAVLVEAVAALRSDLEPDDPQILLAATGAWSIVHGFATLWLDDNVPEPISDRTPDEAAAAALLAFGETLRAAVAPGDRSASATGRPSPTTGQPPPSG